MKFKVEELTSKSTLEWAWEEGFSFDDESEEDMTKVDFIAKVASGGNVELLCWLREEKNCLWEESICRFAASNGHLACLEYLHENRFPWDEERWIEASIFNREGHLLDYLRERYCPGNYPRVG